MPCSAESMGTERLTERPSTFEDGQDIRDRTFAFACRVVGFCEDLYERGGVARMMVAQLLSCSLSCATMLEEARAAESDADFISKCAISLKEGRESWTRLRVCERRGLGSSDESRQLVQEANELISIITTIIRNKRQNAAAAKPKPRRRRSYEFQVPNS